MRSSLKVTLQVWLISGGHTALSQFDAVLVGNAVMCTLLACFFKVACNCLLSFQRSPGQSVEKSADRCWWGSDPSRDPARTGVVGDPSIQMFLKDSLEIKSLDDVCQTKNPIFWKQQLLCSVKCQGCCFPDSIKDGKMEQVDLQGTVV